MGNNYRHRMKISSSCAIFWRIIPATFAENFKTNMFMKEKDRQAATGVYDYQDAEMKTIKADIDYGEQIKTDKS
jgi:hypothetical protein